MTYQQTSVWRMLPSYKCLFLFTQVDLVLDKVGLAGIVVHKMVPAYGIYFIIRFRQQNPAQRCCSATTGLASQAEHCNWLWVYCLKKFSLR